MSTSDEQGVPDPHGDLDAEDVELGRIVARSAGHRDQDVIGTLVIIAERLGRIEDVAVATSNMLDERIPGDLDSNLDAVVKSLHDLDPYGDLNELVRRKLLGHPLP